MKIAICEDEEVMAKKIWNLFFDRTNIEAKYYLNPIELLEQCKKGEKYDVLFCDVCMEPMDGIQLCKEIRRINSQVYIVFITNYIEFAPQGYEVEAFRYLLKPVTEETVGKVLQEIREDMVKTSKVALKTSEGSIILDGKDILYAEIKDKEAYVYYNNEDNVIVGKSLGELEEQLKGFSFFRIHRKYLVNLNRVREFDQYRLTMDSGKSLPISKRRVVEFKKALYDFLENK